MFFLLFIVQATALPLLNVRSTQSDFYEDLSLDLDELQTDKPYSITIDLIVLGEAAPVLFYCPEGFRLKSLDSDQLLSMAAQDQYRLVYSKKRSDCYFDQESIFFNKGYQSLTLTSYHFPLDYQDRYSTYPILASQSKELKLGIALLNGKFAQYEVSITQTFRSDHDIGCLWGCSDNGKCMEPYGICQCFDQWFGRDCSFKAHEWAFPIQKKVTNIWNSKLFMYAYTSSSVVVNLADLAKDEDDPYLKISIDWPDSQEGRIQAKYQCSYPNSDLPFLNSEFQSPHITINGLMNNHFEGTFTTDNIRSCIETSARASQALLIDVVPYLMLTFYNPEKTFALVQLSIDQMASDGDSSNLMIVYILTIVLSLVVMMIIVIIWCKSRGTPAREAERRPIENPIVDRHKRIEQLNKQAYDIYMPPRTYQQAMKEFPEMNEIVECMVCLENWNPEDQVRQTPCQHLFHQACLDRWLGRHQNCPFCRGQLNRRSLREAAEYYSHQASEGAIQPEFTQVSSRSKMRTQFNIPTHLDNEYVKRMRNLKHRRSSIAVKVTKDTMRVSRVHQRRRNMSIQQQDLQNTRNNQFQPNEQNDTSIELIHAINNEGDQQVTNPSMPIIISANPTNQLLPLNPIEEVPENQSRRGSPYQVIEVNSHMQQDQVE